MGGGVVVELLIVVNPNTLKKEEIRQYCIALCNAKKSNKIKYLYRSRQFTQ